MTFNKKVAIITGSSKGIGKAIALGLAKSNSYSAIVVNGLKLNEAEKVCEQIKSIGCNSLAIQADISKEDECIELIRKTIDNFKRLDVLVNNAGIQIDIPLTETNMKNWHSIIDVNLAGPFILSREAVKQMKFQDPKGGCIINISSVHQQIPKPHYIPYSTSKAGLEMMTKTLALEVAKDNIRANLVAPGAIETDMNKELQENNIELERVLKQIPLGRIAKPEEVSNVVEFLASDKASYITGSSFFIDGGMTLYPGFNLSEDHNLKHSHSDNTNNN